MADPGGAPVDSTLALVDRAKAGDRDALDRLFERSLPALRRWAAGRLPVGSRDLMDTDDLVQETAVRATADRSVRATARRRAQAYLRQAVMNRIRDEVRQHDRTVADGARRQPATAARRRSRPRSAARRSSGTRRRWRGFARRSARRSSARVEMDCSYEEAARASGQADRRRRAHGGQPGPVAARRGDVPCRLTPRRCCRSPSRSPTARPSTGKPPRRAGAEDRRTSCSHCGSLASWTGASAPSGSGDRTAGLSRADAANRARDRHLGASGARRTAGAGTFGDVYRAWDRSAGARGRAEAAAPRKGTEIRTSRIAERGSCWRASVIRTSSRCTAWPSTTDASGSGWS